MKSILARLPDDAERAKHVNESDKMQRTPLWLAIFNSPTEMDCGVQVENERVLMTSKSQIMATLFNHASKRY